VPPNYQKWLAVYQMSHFSLWLPCQHACRTS